MQQKMVQEDFASRTPTNSVQHTTCIKSRDSCLSGVAVAGRPSVMIGSLGIKMSAEVLVSEARITSNGNRLSHTTGGAALVKNACLILLRSNITFNTATQGAAIADVSEQHSYILVFGSFISYNGLLHMCEAGGAILQRCVEPRCSMFILNSNFRANRAQRGAGIAQIPNPPQVQRNSQNHNAQTAAGIVDTPNTSSPWPNASSPWAHSQSRNIQTVGLLQVSGAAILRAVHCSIYENVASNRGGGAVVEAVGFFSESEICSNTVRLDSSGSGSGGGGVSVAGKGVLQLLRTNIKNNTAMHAAGGGLHCRRAKVTLTGSLLQGNKAKVGGAAVSIGGSRPGATSWWAGSLVFNQSVVAVNTALEGGGGFAIVNSRLECVHTRVVSNAAARRGGGIAVDGGTIELWYTDVSANNVNGEESLGSMPDTRIW